MILDMYFYKYTEEFVRNNNKRKEAIKALELMEDHIKEKPELKESLIKMERCFWHDYTKEDCYFKNFNALHYYIIENYAKGVDQFQYIIIDKGSLHLIIKALKEIINSKGDEEVCKKLLPTKSGFFFGSKKYNAYYMKNVHHTLTFFEECEKENIDILYQAYW